LFEEHGVPCGPINTYADVFADEQIAARNMVVQTDHPTLGRLRTLGTPLKMSRTPPRPGRAAPLLGQHTDEVLREAGYTPGELTAFRAAGLIR
jgi:formyl-CoA transferase/CoA:oxalate CoA-transferase